MLLTLCCVVALTLTGCGGGGGGGSTGGGTSGGFVPDTFDPDPNDDGGGYVPPEPQATPVAPTPEPATLILFAVGMTGAVTLARKRNKARR
jgi:hypothetical protein